MTGRDGLHEVLESIRLVEHNGGLRSTPLAIRPPRSQSLPDLFSKHDLRLGFLFRMAKRGWLILCFETIRDLNYFWFHFLKLAGNLRNVRNLSLVKNRRDLKRYCWFLQDKEIDILKINRIVPHHFGQDEVYRSRSIKAKVLEIH